MSKRRITYWAKYINEAGLVQRLEITVQATDARTGAEIATREVAAIFPNRAQQKVYDDQVLRIETDAR